MHGSDQLRAHAKAAVTLTDARAHLRELNYAREQGAAVDDDIENAKAAVEAARSAEQKAYLAYTNPFGVVKTV
ncbi:hypothetical protein SEA_PAULODIABOLI_313 [Microbacterium phage PauloDiaboli]|nr:hypothetical protein SEA_PAULODIABOLI_313 [Microbacterium phage PauloDiaboli]